MSSPVSSSAKVFFNPEFEEEIKNMLKDEAHTTLENTSLKLKAVLNEQVNLAIESTVPVALSPITFTITNVSPEPLGIVVNTSVNTCADTASKKVGYKVVDGCVDKTAKQAIEEVVNNSIDSTKSYVSIIYSYIQSYLN